MPLHEWRCQGCKKEVEVIRSFSEHDKQPEEKCDCPEGTDPQWQKFLSKPPQAAYGGSWTGPFGQGGKGRW